MSQLRNYGEYMVLSLMKELQFSRAAEPIHKIDKMI